MTAKKPVMGVVCCPFCNGYCSIPPNHEGQSFNCPTCYNRTRPTPSPSDVSPLPPPSPEQPTAVSEVPEITPPRRWSLRGVIPTSIVGRFAYPVVVLLVAVAVLTWNYDPQAYWNDKPPDSDPETVALFSCSWVLVAKEESQRWCCTMYRDRLECDILGPDGTPKQGLFDSTMFQVDHKPGMLHLAEKYSDKNEGCDYLIHSFSADLLVVERVVGGKPTGTQQALIGRPRVQRQHGPPFWLYVLFQAIAALVAHGVVTSRTNFHRSPRIRITTHNEFIAYLLVHFAVSLVLLPLCFLFPDKGWLNLAHELFALRTLAASLLFGFIGGFSHGRLPAWLVIAFIVLLSFLVFWEPSRSVLANLKLLVIR